MAETKSFTHIAINPEQRDFCVLCIFVFVLQTGISQLLLSFQIHFTVYTYITYSTGMNLAIRVTH